MVTASRRGLTGISVAAVHAGGLGELAQVISQIMMGVRGRCRRPHLHIQSEIDATINSVAVFGHIIPK